jgi:hypothetical protein
MSVDIPEPRLDPADGRTDEDPVLADPALPSEANEDH